MTIKKKSLDISQNEKKEDISQSQILKHRINLQHPKETHQAIRASKAICHM